MMELSVDVLHELRSKFGEAQALLGREDDPDKPHESKYAAIDILNSMLKTLEDEKSNGDVNSLKINVLAQLGSVYYDAEEPVKCQDVLEKALAIVDSVKGRENKIIIPRLICLNQLGILWSSRGDLVKAQTYLESSLKEYKAFQQSSWETIFDIYDQLDMVDGSSSDKQKELELLNTHTFYFLAQVYEKMGAKDRAGVCCHVTLKKQLELKEYQAIDWTINACTLSHFFLVSNKFDLAKNHIASAKFVLEKYRSEMDSKEFEDPEDKNEVMEKIEKSSATCDRAVGKYCYILLAKSHDRFLNLSLTHDELTVEDIENEFDETVQEFQIVEIDPDLESLPCTLAGNFEEAREIFLPGQRYYNKAKNYFTLNEHCIDYVEINQDLSRMTKYLANFETDLDRQFKIHKRRIDLLEKPLQELSEQYYLKVCRQLMFELAETYESMMDAKLDKIKELTLRGETPGPQMITKLHNCIDRSILYFSKYLDSLRTREGEVPTQFPVDDVRPALVAYFHLGRLWDKYIVPEVSQAKLHNVIKMYEHMNMMVEYVRRNPEVEGIIQDELNPAKEMLTLLPVKIEKLRMQLSR